MNRTILTVSLTAAAVILMVAGAQATSSFFARPTAVGVVNLEDLVNGLNEKQAIDADMAERRETLAAEEQQRRSNIERLEFDLNALKPGTSAFNSKQNELERAVIDMQVWVRYEQRRLERELGLKTEELYRRITQAVERVGKDAGYDIVIAKEAMPDVRFEDQQQLAAMIQMRKVLYANPEVDITSQVVRRMNTEYDNLRR